MKQYKFVYLCDALRLIFDLIIYSKLLLAAKASRIYLHYLYKESKKKTYTSLLPNVNKLIVEVWQQNLTCNS